MRYIAGQNPGNPETTPTDSHRRPAAEIGMEFMNHQKRPVYNRNSGLSLIQQNDGREFLLEKMRGKLAGNAVPQFQAMERKRVARQKTAFSWGWKIAMAAVVGLVNVAWM